MLNFNDGLASRLIPTQSKCSWNQGAVKEVLELKSGQKMSQNKELKELGPELGSLCKKACTQPIPFPCRPTYQIMKFIMSKLLVRHK